MSLSVPLPKEQKLLNVVVFFKDPSRTPMKVKSFFLVQIILFIVLFAEQMSISAVLKFFRIVYLFKSNHAHKDLSG